MMSIVAGLFGLFIGVVFTTWYLERGHKYGKKET